MRILLGFLLAIIVVSVTVPWAIEGKIITYPPVFLIGTIPVVSFFSLFTVFPLYIWLRRTQRANGINTLIAAFASGFFSFIAFGMISKPTHSMVGKRVLVESGDFTTAGWHQLLLQSSFVGLSAIVGAIFLVLIIRKKGNG